MSKWIRIFKWLMIIVAGCTLVLSVTLLPEIAHWAATWRFVQFAYLEYPLLFFIWATSVGLYYIIVLVINICSNVQNGKVFTVSTAKLFDRIALIAIVELVAYMIGFIVVAICMMTAHPSFVFLLFLIAFVCLMLFTFCKVMKHLLLRMIDIKEENDYTI